MAGPSRRGSPWPPERLGLLVLAIVGLELFLGLAGGDLRDVHGVRDQVDRALLLVMPFGHVARPPEVLPW